MTAPQGQPVRNPGGLPYGENQELAQIQAAAPMSNTNTTPPPTAIPFTSPTNRPNQPVTAGADAGPGPGSEVLTRTVGAPVGGSLSQALSRAAATDTSGMLSALLLDAMRRGL